MKRGPTHARKVLLFRLYRQSNGGDDAIVNLDDDFCWAGRLDRLENLNGSLVNTRDAGSLNRRSDVVAGHGAEEATLRASFSAQRNGRLFQPVLE